MKPKFFCIGNKFYDWNTGLEITNPPKEKTLVRCLGTVNFWTWFCGESGERCWQVA